ncbi:MAG: GNAT family N-acetyltransferase [Bryobacteraceae bacterium]
MNSVTLYEKFQVRMARVEDSPALARLSTQLGYPVTPEVMAARVAAATIVPSSIVYVAGTSTGEVAGFIHLLHQQLLESEARVEVAGLVVEESFRGRGVGRLLMARAEQWSLDRGCRIVHLRSNIIRAAAHAFYESLGYTHIKTQKAFRKDLK